MAKYKHTKETLIVLRDLENRIQQLIEANEQYRTKSPELVTHQEFALNSCLLLVRQCIKTGHVFRGSSAVPDGLLQYVKTPSVTEQLKIGEQDKDRNEQ
jgi:hypothetical protein